MRRLTVALLACLLVAPSFVLGSENQNAWQRHQAQAARVLHEAESRPQGALTAVDESLPLLRFSEIFQPVVGDRGPEYTPAFRALHGKEVRLSGFMVGRSSHQAGRTFLFAPFPSRIENDGFCLNEDFPPNTLHVEVIGQGGDAIPLLPGKLTLAGKLLVGPRLMPDGRNAIAVLQIPASSLPGFVTASALQP